jgi:hypothetical protein
MHGAIIPLHNTPSWPGAQLKKDRDKFTFTFYRIHTGPASYPMVPVVPSPGLKRPGVYIPDVT